jgi:Family of unknown function (DUF6343)
MADKRGGTFDHPHSALNLRLVLALFGLLVLGAAAVVFATSGRTVPAVTCGVLALVALANVIVVQRRRIVRRRRSPGTHYSLFE